ncbi:GMC family oxidoreductase [Gluconobacter kondonii]|uniref:Choline dehydrogenase n=1 Tax=Gluconobacter kondonii TaxID=941463 RepID=A0ABQ5WU40_9PROT|nr:GMC family oxidoreductase [Gluconobacter kondonii]GLQ66613.1 choline dehydrogenase [Gluconobacter kondonii]
MTSEKLHADVVVVGSGVSGGLVGSLAARAGKSVIILEAGPRVKRHDIVETYRNAPVKLSLANMKLQGAGSPYPSMPYAPSTYGDYLEQLGPVPFKTSYLRVVGGTTWHFGSALWRLIPNDFRLQTLYGRGRDWPISYADLEPYYCRAEEELGVSGVDGQDEGGNGGGTFPPRSKPFPMSGLPAPYFFQRLPEQLLPAGYHPVLEPNGRATRPYGQRPVCAGNNNCNPVCPIGAKYDGTRHVDQAEAHGATILPNSVVYRIEDDASGQIVAVWFKKPDGTEHRVTGKYFVIAAHAVETPKLLLMSQTRHSPNGIANSSDQVGRNLMDTSGISMGMMAAEDMWPGQGPTELLVYLNARDGEFRKNYPQYKTKLRNVVPTSQIASGLLSKGVVGKELDKQIRLQSARSIRWAVDFEMLPLPTNRVILSAEKKDALGLPVPAIQFDIDDYWKAGREAAQIDLKRIAGVLGGEVTKFGLKPENRQHPSGTTIMGSDPKNSVVDEWCRAHDHKNLFIAGTSVMSSSSCMNPTLTAAALSIRIADTIISEI